MYTGTELRSLVQQDKVHRRIYTDKNIFELEMQKIFGRLWVFVGHESQVPEKHDYITTNIGHQPVILARAADNNVRIFFNRCSHRGVKLCTNKKGSSRSFVCPYHGWAFKNDGKLLGTPYREGFDDKFFDIEDLDLKSPAQVDSYRGFIFASLSSKIQPLHDYLGGIKSSIDDLCDRAPDGEISATAGCNRYIIRSNWKQQIDNAVDLYHAPFAHASTLDEDGRQFSRHGGGPSFYKPGTKQFIDFDPMGVWGFENGHGFQGAVPQVDRPTGGAFNELYEALEARHGQERADQILAYDRFNSVIYPNLTFQAFGQHIRVIIPISVERTEIRIYPVLLKGAPERWNREAVRSVASTHSPASMIQTDDVAVFERAQLGLKAESVNWVHFARHMGAEEPDARGGHRGPGSSEFVLRRQYNEVWLKNMCE